MHTLLGKDEESFWKARSVPTPVCLLPAQQASLTRPAQVARSVSLAHAAALCTLVLLCGAQASCGDGEGEGVQQDALEARAAVDDPGTPTALALLPALLQRAALAGAPQAILDGKLALSGDYAATGAILYSSGWPERTRPPIGAMICTGTLIAPDVVLAAGHCRENVVDRGGASVAYFFSLSPDVSSFGPHVRAFPPDAVRVAHFAAHPAYGKTAHAADAAQVADIALLFLERPILNVAYAELLPEELADTLEAGKEVTIVGYGRRNLHFLGTGDGGLKSIGRSTLHRVGAFELQVGLGPQDAYKCWGDSGGPTFLAAATGEQHLVGVTSRAADSGGCRSAGIDTRVDVYRGWVAAKMAAACGTAQRPACSPSWRTLRN